MFEPEVQKVAEALQRTLRRKEPLLIEENKVYLTSEWFVVVDTENQRYRLIDHSIGLIVEQVDHDDLTNFRRAVWYHKDAVQRSRKKDQQQARKQSKASTPTKVKRQRSRKQ